MKTLAFFCAKALASCASLFCNNIQAEPDQRFVSFVEVLYHKSPVCLVLIISVVQLVEGSEFCDQVSTLPSI